MLSVIFYWILNMSILATIYGIFLYFLRYIRRMPRTAIYSLWAVVLFRMLCPVGFSSKYSLMSMLEAVLRRSVVRTVPVDDMQLSLSNSIQAVDIYQPIEYKSQAIKDFLSVTSAVWLIVAAVAVLSMFFLYFLSSARLRGAVKIKDNVYEGSMVTTPMICGIIHPRIILSPGTKDEEMNYILAHEKTHGRRRDNLWRMLAITAACIHWFNPFSWLFLKLFFADCELACDEAVVKKLSLKERNAYATAMLSYVSADNTFFSSAFGGGVKTRIQRVLSYRRLTWFSILTFTLMAGVIAYILLTNGAPKEVLANEETDLSNAIAAEYKIRPVPASDASVDWECGTYYSNISKSNMQEYLTKLARAGWKDFEGKDIATEVMNGTTSYDLRYKDHILQLITYLVDTENAICNSILVYYDEELSYEEMMSRIGTIDKPEALSVIQTQVKELSQQGEIPDTKDIVTGLFELPVKNAYEKMQVQAFAAISDMGFTGCFLLRKGVASYVPGNLSSAQVTDIDQDGSYELLNSYDRYEANTYCLELAAYCYENPDNINSLPELTVEKYHTCYVPKKGYEQFQLVMEEQGNLILMSEDGSYGTITVEEGTLCIQGEKASELLPWSSAFDQSNLKTLRKIDPSEPPEITISLEENELRYVTWKTNWMGTEQEYSYVQILEQIKQSKIEIPAVHVGSFNEEESDQRISIDFGESMPDSIQVFDALIDESGSPRYQLDYEQAVQIMSDSRVEFPLSQHMAYYLSSESRDYDRDWKRLFRVVCTWGEKQCTYAFAINTGEK